MHNKIGKAYDIERQKEQRFQKELAAFVKDKGFKKMVETGCGASTVFMLWAIEHTLDMEDARVYSIDPNPWYEHEIVSDQHELIKQTSEVALVELAKRVGEFDFFLHDSNHDIRCMTYELEFAYGCLKGGGYIACDDYTWGGHGAWQNFVANHDLKPFAMGSIMIAQKPVYVPIYEDFDKHHKDAVELAANAEEMWLRSGNKNSEIEWVRV